MLWTLWGLGHDNGDLKPLNGISKSQVKWLVLVKIREEKESMDSELARDRVSKWGRNRFRVKFDCKNLYSLIVDLLYVKDN